MNNPAPPVLRLADRVADRFRKFSIVESIALGGSQATGQSESDSDIDLYVYTTGVIPLRDRVEAVTRLGAVSTDLNLEFWGLGDEWFDEETGIEVDVIYWEPVWIGGQLDRVLIEHQASLGYTTCFWHTIKNSVVLYDNRGWLRRLKEKIDVPFPESLRRAIIAKNHPVIRRIIPSYLHQIENAIRRQDTVSINHRVTALLASYFDLLFALNRLPNPGEKRLLNLAECCPKVPVNMVSQVGSVLRAASLADSQLVVAIKELVDSLDQLLEREGFDPKTSLPVKK